MQELEKQRPIKSGRLMTVVFIIGKNGEYLLTNEEEINNFPKIIFISQKITNL